jgi:TusA-related sulfurtransferase
MPRITLKSNIIKELSKGNTLFILGTEVSSNNNIPSNNKAPIS